MRRPTIPKRLISVELANPSLASESDLARLRGKLSRDFPWLLEDGWDIELWGLRPDSVRSAAAGQIRSVGPRLPSAQLPRPLVVVLAWASHFLLAAAKPPAGIVVAGAPYSAVGLTLARIVRRLKAPLIVRVEGVASSRALLVRRSALRFHVLRTIEVSMLRRADLVVPMGPFTERFALRAGVNPTRIIDLPFPTGTEGRHRASPMADGRDPLCVACAARLVPEKGIDVLLRAWHRVVSHVPQARLEIAGDGPARAKLHRLVADLGIGDSVRFSGWLRPEGMSELFSRASIVVLPSRWEEGLGMVLVEGGLSGCALIGSDLGGIRDIIEPEETGLVFPAEDADALEAALVRCLRDAALTRRLGVAAQARAERYLARRDRQLDRLRIAVESLRVGTTSGSPPGGTA